MVVLAVQIDEQLPESLQQFYGDGQTIRKAAAPALLVHFAAQDQLAVIDFDPLGFNRKKRGMTIRKSEYGFYDTAILASSNHVRIRSGPQDQAERPDQNRFSGSRLARNNVETAVEVNLDFFDQCLVDDV